MAAAVRIEGDPAAQLRKLSRDLKAMGSRDLQRELRVSLLEAAGPMIDAAKRSAGDNLPSSGGRGVRSHNRRTGARQAKLKTRGFAFRDGQSSRVESLAGRVQNARFSVRPKGIGIVLRATEASGRSINLDQLDKGKFRAPLFGMREHWYPHKVPEGWWTKPMQEHVVFVEPAIKDAIARCIVKFESSLF